MRKDSNWFLVFRKERDSFKVFLYFLIALIPEVFLVSLIHESGHIIIALLFQWDIIEVEISFFPLIANLDPSFVRVIFSYSEYFEWQLIVFLLAGSINSLIFGYIFFIIYYKFNLPLFLEIILFSYSVILILEMFFYLVLDIFFYQIGDWFYMFSKNPTIVLIFLVLGIMNLFYYVRNFEVMFNKLDE